MPPLQVLEIQQRRSQSPETDSELAGHIALMGNSTLFAGVSPSHCRDILSFATTRVFAPREALYMQGHPVRTHVLVETGIVKVIQVSVVGREVLLWMNGPGESVGISNELPCHRHACSARAVERCQALTWEDSRFQTLIGWHPQIAININLMLAAQLGELEQRFREIATEKAAMRLSLALSRLGAQIGKPIRGGTEIRISREELAQMIGTTLFTVSRILTKWADEGFIASRRHNVSIYDTRRLELAGADTTDIPN
jgi:CRP-like cAMP-binding protein